MPGMASSVPLQPNWTKPATKKPFSARTLILGNSGSGKSWLAFKIAEAFGCKAVDLDMIHWEPGSYGVARDKQVAIDMVHQEASDPAWVIEGVFGWLAQEALPRALALICWTCQSANAWTTSGNADCAAASGNADCAAAATQPRSRDCWTGRRITMAGRHPAHMRVTNACLWPFRAGSYACILGMM